MPAANILQTLPFGLGEVDISTLGVSLDAVATAGPEANPPTVSDDNMLIVDDLATPDCPNAEFHDINSAIAAATPGDKIKVCPGVYIEQVEIPASKDNITLFSEGDERAIIKAPPTMVPPKAIVHIAGATGVTIRHFTITGPGGGGCHSIEYGVRVDGGGSALIWDNHITEIRDAPFSGCQNGVGVLVGRNFENETGFATVVHNLIDKYQKGGVVVDGRFSSPSSSAEVAYNEIIGMGPTPVIAQNGVQVSRNAKAEVHHNKISLNNYGPLDTVSEGILLYNENPSTSVHHNYSFLNDDGVGLYTSHGTEVSHNRLERNDFDGIYADTDTIGNTISYNRAEDNAAFDCEDNSPPANMSLSSNFWIKDLGDTENKPGLCKATPKS